MIKQTIAVRPSKPRKWIGTLELAAKLRCHPMSIPRFVKTKPGFPQPTKMFGKNIFDEDEADAYVEAQVTAARKEDVA